MAFSRPCRWSVIGFAALYVLAFALFLIGSFGSFGSPQGPLAGVFLVPLGLPWVLGAGGVPEPLRPAAGVVAPALNLLLWGLCRWRSQR